MNVASIIELLVFFFMFGMSFYALSCIKFETFCKTNPPARVYVLLFLLSLALAWISSQAILQMTIYNGL